MSGQARTRRRPNLRHCWCNCLSLPSPGLKTPPNDRRPVRDFCGTREHLRAAIWQYEPAFPDQAVLDHASKLREALTAALRSLGVKKPGDPLPSTGKGKDLAYRLDLFCLTE